jgi:pimeloyl-ACP methyl ester carboxylesterase
MLMGGPGFSGSFLDEYATKVISDSTSNLAVYILDQRGMSRSSPLDYPSDCQSGESMGECVSRNYGPVLPFYSVTETAYDVIALIKQFSSNAQKFLYAWSYGTYLGNRVLTINNAIVDKVIFEGTCPSKGCSFGKFDVNVGLAAANFLRECAQASEDCEDYLGLYPGNTLALILQQIESGQLPCLQKLTNLSNVTPYKLKFFFGAMMTQYGARPVILAVAKRLLFCSDSDGKELDVLFSKIGGFFPSQKRNGLEEFPPDGFGVIVGSLITVSELLDVLPSKGKAYSDYIASMASSDEALIATMGQSIGIGRLGSGNYPYYNPDEFYGQFAQVKVPFLAIQGEYDPQTSIAFLHQAKLAYSRSNLFKAIVIPYGVHQSSGDDTSRLGINCGRSIIAQFVNSTSLNLDCIAATPVFDFDGNTPGVQGYIDYWLGTSSVWGKK